MVVFVTPPERDAWGSSWAVLTTKRCGRGGELPQPRRGQAVDAPAVHGFGTQSVVELDGGGIPVEHRPLHAAVTVTDTLLDELVQQRLAPPRLTVVGSNVEILEMDAVYPVPGGEIQKPQGESHDLPALFGDMAEQRGVAAEQRG